MSLGYSTSSRVVRSALQDALDHNIVVVASSGNSGDTPAARDKGHAPYSFPADYPGVLGVAAVNKAGRRAYFSSSNLSVEVTAPGVNVPAQGSDGGYWLVSGTSPACALTAGVAALIKSRYPDLTPARIRQAITTTTRGRPGGGYNDQVGFGTVNAAAALTAAGVLAGQAPRRRSGLARRHFGGGPGAIPPAPIGPRGAGTLVLLCLLGAGCLASGQAGDRRVPLMRRMVAARSAAAQPVYIPADLDRRVRRSARRPQAMAPMPIRAGRHRPRRQRSGERRPGRRGAPRRPSPDTPGRQGYRPEWPAA